MRKGRIIAILGDNASGKTQYVEQMRRRLASDTVRYIAFRDSYGANIDGAYYLQLRWNQHDIDAETPTVGQLLEKSFSQTGADTAARREQQKRLYALFHLTPLLDKLIISLSSGELRKYQLAKSLMSQPQTVIIDNPFIGLDAKTRKQLHQLLQDLVNEQDLTIYLVVSRSEDIPEVTDDIIHISAPENPSVQFTSDKKNMLLSLPSNGQWQNDTDDVIDMRNITIRYGERTILRDLNWIVRKGERWALSGENGSGKSTLLSLICADNPQSYACDIRLFGHQRGSGESIWDIKKHIGYVSPEMHRSYYRNLPCLDIVTSGLKDSVGLYVRANDEEKKKCLWWMNLFGIGHLAHRSFVQVSSGEQRLVLLARAFVKDPELLILDEPLHGLDEKNRKMVKDIINTFCERPNKTLIMVTHYEEELPSCINQKKILPTIA